MPFVVKYVDSPDGSPRQCCKPEYKILLDACHDAEKFCMQKKNRYVIVFNLDTKKQEWALRND